MPMNKKVLFITSHKLDDNNGGSNASKGFARCFASIFNDLSLIFHEIERTEPYIPANVRLFPMHDDRMKIRKLFDMYRGVLNYVHCYVKEHLKTHQYDIVVIDHSFTGAGLCKYIKSTGAKLITIHHNVERDYLRDNSKERPLSYRYPLVYYSKKAERDCLQYSDVNLTVTKKDAETFRSWYPNPHLHNWGIFEYQSIPEKTFEAKEKSLTFVVTGSLCFVQSLQPIMDFIQRYWPIVLQAYPQARLLVAGRNPSKQLQEACSSVKSISIIPNPTDIATIVQQGNYYVCPIYAGSGLKLRIWDGLKQGLPIICHRVSTAGYEGIMEKGCLFAYNDETTFSTSLRQMVTADLSPEKVYRAYKDTFSVETGIERLHDILIQENII